MKGIVVLHEASGSLETSQFWVIVCIDSHVEMRTEAQGYATRTLWVLFTLAFVNFMVTFCPETSFKILHDFCRSLRL